MNEITLEESKSLIKIFGLPLSENITPEAIASQSMSDRVKSIAIAYGQETQLELIAYSITLDFKLLSLSNNTKMSGLIKSLLNSLGMDETTRSIGNIYLLMPMFFSFDMKNEMNSYLPPSLQKLLWDEFIEHTKSFNLSIEEIKEKYLKESPLNLIQPIKPKVDKFISQLTLGEIDELKGFKKMRFHLKSLGTTFFWILIALIIFAAASLLPKSVIKFFNG